MQISVFKDFLSLSFIRCVSPIEGSRYYSEGSGFTLKTALAKCLSEKIEREFLIKNKIYAIGAAAHSDKQLSQDHAINEALESLLLEKIANDKLLCGFHFRFHKSLSVSIAKVNGAWFSFISSTFNHQNIYTYAVRPTLLSSLLQSWSELRNIQIYKPAGKILKTYTKANRLLIESPKLKFSLSPYVIKTSNLKIQETKINYHFVTYIQKGA